MQVVILAGGLGTRLRPITESIPKPMVEVNGKPFLFYQIEMLRLYGFTDILILAGYLGYMIEEYFGDGSAFGMKITYSYEKDELLGTGGALKLAQDKLQDEFIIINGDSYLGFDYHELVAVFHNHQELSGLFTVFNNKGATSDVKSNIYVENGIIAKYEKGTLDPKFHYVDAGVIIIKKSILDAITSGVVLSLEADILQKEIDAKKIGYYETDHMFYDIGTFDRLSIFKNILTN